MELIIRLSAIALCGAIFASFLRPLSPVFGLLTALACSILLLTAILDPVGQMFHTLSVFLTATGISGEIYLPVIKAVGIATVVHIAAQICRDTGEGALGNKLELAGTITAMVVCIPLMQQVFTLLGSMLA